MSLGILGDLAMQCNYCRFTMHLLLFFTSRPTLCWARMGWYLCLHWTAHYMLWIKPLGKYSGHWKKVCVFMSRPVWPAGHYASGLSVLPSFRPSRFRGTTLCPAPSKSYAFSTNYHACIAMPTWPRCAPPILCWPWPPYNLFLRSCLTWNFSSILTDGYHFACSAQQKLCLFNKLSCMHCNANMT